ncbi:MAG: hypothetical protein JXA60_07570 [Candidatus Coatesbacteria bacterium]|nr:hypothetical protein [Candidatus Coatesbacteria bacterium]
MNSYENTFGIVGYFTPPSIKAEDSENRHFLAYRLPSNTIRSDTGLLSGFNGQKVAVDGYASPGFYHKINLLITDKNLKSSEVGTKLLELISEEDYSLSLAYISPHDNNFLIAADRTGSQSLYYSTPISQKIFFGTDIRLILYHNKNLLKIDQASVLTRLLIGYPLLDDTLFQNIKQLEPGEYIWHQGNRLLRGFHWKPIKKTALNDEEVIPEAKKVLKQIFSFLTNEEDYVLTLSGGSDSRFLLAAMIFSGYNPAICSFGRKSSLAISISEEIANKFKLEYQKIILNKKFLSDLAENAVEISSLSMGMLNWNYAHALGVLKSITPFSKLLISGSWAWDTRGKWEKGFSFMEKDGKHWQLEDFCSFDDWKDLIATDFIEESKEKINRSLQRAEERYKSIESSERAKVFAANHKNMKRMGPLTYTISAFVQPFYPLHSKSWIEFSLSLPDAYNRNEKLIWDFIKESIPDLMEFERDYRGISISSGYNPISWLTHSIALKIGVGEKPKLPTDYGKWTGKYLRLSMKEIWNNIGPGYGWILNKEFINKVLDKEEMCLKYSKQLNRIFSLLSFLQNISS